MSKLLEPLYEREALMFKFPDSRGRYVSHRLAGATISEAICHTEAMEPEDGETTDSNNLVNGA